MILTGIKGKAPVEVNDIDDGEAVTNVKQGKGGNKKHTKTVKAATAEEATADVAPKVVKSEGGCREGRDS